MDAMMFSCMHRTFWWISKVQCAFQFRELCLSGFMHDGLAVGPPGLECAKESFDFEW
jgi:hypothetical protein